MYRYLSLSRHLIVGLVTSLGIFVGSAPANAAQSVVLKYSIFRETISVPELTTFAKTGELSPALTAYLKLAGREPAQLRRTLSQEIPVSGTLLYGVLSTPVGKVMLDQVSEVVHTPDNQANQESLRGALVNSALPDGKITLIETLENYPTPEVHVEGDRLVEVIKDITRVLGRLPKIGL
ncbi:MAG TPA: alpha/beta hydrolase [Cyanobacteria bacterium UBA8553]|nr:alpha/beta hydrolase [Cyanobacteria bacterium UBA8553]HAJ62498.1 alpha/beta hydrolase [Cyanobacteria bacterium UBA8543]